MDKKEVKKSNKKINVREYIDTLEELGRLKAMQEMLKEKTENK